MFQHGVHTIELNGNTHVNIAKLYGEYMTTAETEEAIQIEREKRRNESGNLPTVTRIDYRFDSRDETYKELFPRMRQLVLTFAYRHKMIDRIQTWGNDIGIMHSIRAMPDGNDHQARYGIEFYDKLYQTGTEAYGKARLELRALNMDNERLSWVKDNWKQNLSRTTQQDYRKALETHAAELLHQNYSGERIGIFIRRILPWLIGREEERIIYKLAGKRPQQREACENLPTWDTLQQTIETIEEMLIK